MHDMTHYKVSTSTDY